MIRYLAAHPNAANLLMLIIVAAGVLSIPQIQRETFPRYAADRVGVEIAYPGATAADVEDAVCQRLEDALQGTTGLEELRCEARENLGFAVAELREGGDAGRFLDDVKTEVEAIDDFPERAERPIVRELGRTDFVASLAVTGPMSDGHLKAYAEDLKGRLLQLEEVSQVDLKGFSDHQFRVEVDRTVLRQHGLSAAELGRRIASQNVDLPGGVIETADQDVLIRMTDERRSVEDLEALVVIGGASGGEITLGDIATVTDRFEDEAERIEFNGRRAALLELRKTRSEDALRVVDAVRDYVAQERRRMPETVSIKLTQNVSSIVRDRLSMLAVNGLQGLVLVFLAMWAFFSFRFSFWVALGLPVSFLGTVFFMHLFGLSLNMISMVGLLMAIGLLMDDAIVIAENIAAHLREGREPLDAVVHGVRQVAPGVLSSFITTLAVFGPLAFISGDIGQVLRVMPIVLLVTLAVSLLEAFFILPHHLVGPVRRMARTGPSRFRAGLERRFEWLREHVVGAAADLAVRWRYPLLGALLFGAALTVGLLAGGRIQFQAFPDIDGDVVHARLLMPQGTPLHVTRERVGRIVQALEQVNAEQTPRQPGTRPLVQSVQVRFGENADAGTRGAHLATVIVDLLGAEQRRLTLDELYQAWRDALGPLPDAMQFTLQEPGLGPQGRALEFRLSGTDLDRLKAAAAELRGWLAGFEGAHDLMDDLRPGKPERRVRLREGASALGLTSAEIADQLRAAFLGQEVAEVQVGPEGYEIEVRLAAGNRDSLADLSDFAVTMPNGDAVPLDAVAEIEPARGWAQVVRIDGRRSATVIGDVDTAVANTMAIINRTRTEFLPQLRERFPGVDASVEGQARESASTGQSVARGFVIGLLGIFVVLAFQFRSYVEPLAVMVAIPMAMMGAAWGHFLTGYDLSMPSVVGAASLAGIVVNDSILLVYFIKMRVAEGRAVAEAARLASRDRFRAVLLTSLTTILGLFPLLAETSLQAQVLKPLVISVVFGLLVSTVLILLVLPALYSVLDDLGLARAGNEGIPAEVAGG
ncbi:efflux RND transporter permease subunit [Ectothiorhodospiraceae bacterium WFHF3C12]|nr:efflux RND transporter permease subunit [Ectothiorhodospiraceae bacterium WFHF3C12]